MSESSSEDENTARLKEAVWSFNPTELNGNGKYGDKKPSQRVDISKHAHDGNELQTTPEFQSHVAKKLGAILDGRISEVCCDTVTSCQTDRDDEEKGFRLFSTSARGTWMEKSPPPPPKRKPVPSSSESDDEMEMRLREAAVSFTDILRNSAQKPQTVETPEEKKAAEILSEPGEQDAVTKKKKKKKKRKKMKTLSVENGDKTVCSTEEQSCKEAAHVVENSTSKKKKKRRKRMKLAEGTENGDD